ncbi:MAG: hypothetical protein RI572_07045 [Salegentibacter sp.]|uniref:hypothetical protein n=1 Tax=Salegentibacter sp. TaxID=1903072 RepID=UPI00286FDC36|nr:hypothetical protein [Salegentibacter sp.]MDR9457150.1 hypothetical protein [Salegentibacter sp.]
MRQHKNNQGGVGLIIILPKEGKLCDDLPKLYKKIIAADILYTVDFYIITIYGKKNSSIKREAAKGFP